ncbi:endonuclease/exonuclease/phosphatase family protein [Microbacterium sp. P05]|uniref:endonuclease/exonuclease/phosphatase family protein n=1 Tax=Microbacterium sp. P05 TaxID=3366948 RepID=UPI003745EE25
MTLVGAVASPALHVMTFNVRRRMSETVPGRSADRWSTRLPILQQVLREERPTVVGVQEALPDQAAAIGEALGPSYRFVGFGRNAGRRGEACPLFFDTDRLAVQEWSQTALSERPDEPGSTSWGGLIPRVVVRALFRDRASSTVFAVWNTHLDPFSARARKRTAAMLAADAGGADVPLIVTGDFNAPAGSATWRTLLAGNRLRDAWPAAAERLTPEWGTFANYRRPRIGKGRIDGILVSDDVVVQSIGINANRTAAGWPSDHLPVQAVVQLGGGSR